MKRLKDLFEISDKAYETRDEVKTEYSQKIANDHELRELEGDWVENNLQPIFDLMGDWNLTWDIIFGGVDKINWRTGVSPTIPKGGINTPMARFYKGHWYTAKVGDTTFYNSYKEDQPQNTNGFCQTFSMMYLLDKLPTRKYNTGKGKKSIPMLHYYNMTLHALNFIIYILETYPIKQKKKYIDMVHECRRHHKTCLNVIIYL